MQPSAVLAASTQLPSPPRQPQSPVREAFAFLTRGRKKSSSSSGSPRSTLSKHSRALPASLASTSTSTETDSSRHSQSPGIAPNLDMVRSPAEDSSPQNPTVKSVDVQCRDVMVTVQVTKGTSTAELLADCSKLLAKLDRPIRPDASVVIEPCIRPGLERRLRQYERVWDVINAWDPHASNALIILPNSSDPNGELSLSSVPKTLTEPEGFVLPLYFLQRPGKWAQRYITLKENGQIFASKKKEWKNSDKDVSKLCHLSDFDLYLPTEVEIKKKLRPPKRYCYAIRSQEKASLFLDSTHYVHFFCTDDRDVSRRFRSCVHGWRSWYLVNRKLNLHEERLSSQGSMFYGDNGYKGTDLIDQSPRKRPSMDQAPLIRPTPSTRESTPPDAATGSGIPPTPALPTSLRGKKAPVFEATGLLGDGYDERRQQALRQNVAARQRKGTVNSSDDGPFIDGPSLLNGHAATTPTSDSNPRTAGSDGSYDKSDRPGGWHLSALQQSADQRSTRPSAPAALLARRPSTATNTPSRTGSVRQRGGEEAKERHAPLLHQQPTQQPQQNQRRPLANNSNNINNNNNNNNSNAPGPPQPLIDLTPSFIEPPQWSRENKGRGVRAPQGKPLVDLATGPPLPTGTAARFRDAAAPPKSLIRRPDPLLSTAGSGVPGSGGPTLMQQYDLQMAAGRRRGQTLGLAEGGGGSSPLLQGGLERRHTVRSKVGGSQPPVPTSGVSSSAAAAAYMQTRAKMMGLGQGETERIKERLRNGDGWGQRGLAVRPRGNY
ncbi:hypothetical protein P885DRAFT_68746 [Corynascus similis CBS 632.67]